MPSSNGNPSDTRVTENAVLTVNEMAQLVREFHETLVANIDHGARQAWMRRTGGQSTKRDYDQECDYPKTFSADDYLDLFYRFPIPNRVVNIFPKQTWQVQPTVYEDEDPDTETEFEIAWNELGSTLDWEPDYYEQEEGSAIWNYLLRLDILSGIGQYGVLFLGIDDGLDFNQPVRGIQEFGSAPREIERPPADGNGKARTPSDLFNNANLKPRPYHLVTNAEKGKTKNKNKLLYLRPLPEALAIATSFESNPMSPRFGQPVTYQITFNDPRIQYGGSALGVSLSTFDVHWTRVIHVADNCINTELFGLPRMWPVMPNLLDLCRKFYGASGEMYWQGAFPGISFTNPPQLGPNVNIDKEKFKDQLEQYFNSLQRWMVNKNLQPTMLAPTVSDPTPFIKSNLEAICIQIDVPMRKFMGSERGELASSDDDDDWNDVLRHRQGYHVTPRIIRPFANRCINLGILPVPKKGWRADWADLDAQSEESKADVAVKKTTAITQFASGGGTQVMTLMDFYVSIMGYTEEEAQSFIDNVTESHTEPEDDSASPLLGTVGGITAVTELFKQAAAGGISEDQVVQMLMLFFNVTEERAKEVVADGFKPPAPPAPPMGIAGPGAAPDVAGGTAGGTPPPKPGTPAAPPKPGEKATATPTPDEKAAQAKPQPKAEEKKPTGNEGTENVFCPTGLGGGVDPTCSSGNSPGIGAVAKRSMGWRQLDDELTAHYKTVKLTPDETQILKNYTGTLYKELGKKMRSCPPDFGCLDGKLKKDKDVIEGALSKAGNLPRPTLTYRGFNIKDNSLKEDYLANLEKRVDDGQPIRVPSFMSTTIDINTARDFSPDSGSIIFHILAKRGLYLDSISVHEGEFELLQSSNTRYRVVSVNRGLIPSARVEVYLTEVTGEGHGAVIDVP